MTDTTSAAPSDAEIDAQWRESVAKHETTAAFVRDFARAVLAKWGAPQPVAREPLTDAQIAEMMRETWGCASIAPRHALEFARAVERAHGIAQKGGAAALDCHHRPPCDECAAYDAQGGK